MATSTYSTSSVRPDAFNAARAIPDPAARVDALIGLLPCPPRDELEAIVPEVLATARAISDPYARARALTALAPFLPNTALRELEAARNEAFAALRAIPAERIRDERIRESIDRLSKTDPKDVQQIAASQLALLTGYHEITLAQSRESFRWAIVGAGIGLVLFIVAVTISLLKGAAAASIPLLSSAVVEAISGIVFYLYGKTSSHLVLFHSRLEILQRYLLANSLCESLEGDDRNKARVALIQEISRPHQPSSPQNS